MNKKLTEKQEAESLFIREWCLTIIDFVYLPITKDLSALIEMRKEALGEEMKKAYLEKVTPSIYMKGLKEAFNDLNGTARDLPPKLLEELNKILRDKFGKDISTYSLSDMKQIVKITNRRKIVNEDEFRLINERVNELCEMDSESSELEVLNGLLSMYELQQK